MEGDIAFLRHVLVCDAARRELCRFKPCPHIPRRCQTEGLDRFPQIKERPPVSGLCSGGELFIRHCETPPKVVYLTCAGVAFRGGSFFARVSCSLIHARIVFTNSRACRVIKFPGSGVFPILGIFYARMPTVGADTSRKNVVHR